MTPRATQQHTEAAAGRGTADAMLGRFLGGDWLGAVATVVTGLGAMIVVALAAALLAGIGRLGGHAVLAATFAAVAAGVGGSVHVTGFAEAEIGAVVAMPLTLTLLGFALIGWRFTRSLPRGRVTTGMDMALQATRTALVFLVLLLIVGNLARYTVVQSPGFGFELELGRVAVDVRSTVLGGLVWLIVTLAVAVTVARSVELPPRLRRIQVALRSALITVAWLVGIALIAGIIIGVTSIGGSHASTQAIGAALLMAPNLACALLLLAFGVPAQGSVTGSIGPLGGALTGSSDRLTLLTLTEHSIAWWLLPLVATVVLLLAASAAMSRAHTREDRRWVAYGLGLVLAAAFLVMAVAVGVTATVAPSLPLSLPLSGSIVIHFDGPVAIALGAVWGLLAGFTALVTHRTVAS